MSILAELEKIVDAAAQRAVARVLEHLPEIIRAELDRRHAGALLSHAALAKRLGISAKALSARLARGSELAALALNVGGRRVWRAADLDAALARGRR